MSLEEDKKYISDLLNTRAVLKQDIYKKTKEWFAVLKQEVIEIVEELRVHVTDERIRLRYVDKSDTEVQLYIGSDVIVFAMHTNVFKFSDSDYASQTSYVQNNPANGYCGVVQIYNFLADSYEFNRPNDVGYLIGRLFINREDHFIMEGKQQLSFLYRDFMHQVLSGDKLHEIINKTAIAAIDFELLSPPYQAVEQTTVYELQTLSHSSELKTGKRLGFKFNSDIDIQG
jgi:hypothetical protein